jgi:hypothetical protein
MRQQLLRARAHTHTHTHTHTLTHTHTHTNTHTYTQTHTHTYAVTSGLVTSFMTKRDSMKGGQGQFRPHLPRVRDLNKRFNGSLWTEYVTWFIDCYLQSVAMEEAIKPLLRLCRCAEATVEVLKIVGRAVRVIPKAAGSSSNSGS